MSSILNALQTQGLPYTSSALAPANSYLSTTSVSINEADSEVAQASVSLSANLNNVTAATGTGQLTLAFARALQGATQVDPVTGHRELIAGANTQLTATLTSLLEQNGFTAGEASAATSSLAAQLAQGGPIKLSASYGQLTHNNGTLTTDYGGSATSSVSAVDSTQRASTITIGINLDTGALSVALKSQNSAVYVSNGEINGSGSISAPVGLFLQLPVGEQAGPSGSTQSDFGQALSNQSLASLAISVLGEAASGSGHSGFGTASAFSPLTESETDTFSSDESVSLTLTDFTTPGSRGNVQQSVNFDQSQNGTSTYSSSTSENKAVTSNSSANNALQQLLAELNQSKLLGQKETSELLQSLPDISAKAKAAAQAQGAAGGTAAVAALNGNATTEAGASNTVSVDIGVTQTIALQQLDANGYGNTLYKRPDGSLGLISTQPTHVTA